MHCVSKKCFDHKNFMMNAANACCIVTLKVHATHLVTTTVTVVFSQEPIIQMTSLKVFPCRTGMGNPNQCSTSYLASSWVYYNHTFMLGNNGHLHNMCLHPHMG